MRDRWVTAPNENGYDTDGQKKRMLSLNFFAIYIVKLLGIRSYIWQAKTVFSPGTLRQSVNITAVIIQLCTLFL